MKTGKMIKSVPIVKDADRLMQTSFSVSGDEMGNESYEQHLLASSLASLGSQYAQKHAVIIKLFTYLDKKGRKYETPDPLDEDYMASAGFILDSYTYFIML